MSRPPPRLSLSRRRKPQRGSSAFTSASLRVPLPPPPPSPLVRPFIHLSRQPALPAVGYCRRKNRRCRAACRPRCHRTSQWCRRKRRRPFTSEDRNYSRRRARRRRSRTQSSTPVNRRSRCTSARRRAEPRPPRSSSSSNSNHFRRAPARLTKRSVIRRRPSRDK